MDPTEYLNGILGLGGGQPYNTANTNTFVNAGNVGPTVGNAAGLPTVDSNQWIGGLDNVDALKGGLGIGQLGLGVLSYLDQKGLYDKQKQLMGQQIDQNKFLINQAKQRQKDIAGAFGSGGLAASTMNK